MKALTTYGLWVAVIAALVGCYVGALHYALHHFSRSRLEELLERKGRTAWLDRLDERQGYILLTAVLRVALNLLILIAAIGFFAPPGSAGDGWLGILWAFLAAGALISTFGVAVASSWGEHAAEPLLGASLPFLHVAHFLFTPLLKLMEVVDPLVRRLLGVPAKHAEDAAGLEQEILDVVSEGEKTGLVDEQQAHMIEAVVEFRDTTVDEIMTPRTDVVGIEAAGTLEDVKRIAREAGHSRFPVFDDNLDNIIGVLYVKDLLHLVGTNGDNPFDLRRAVRPALFVPESKTLRDLLAEMQQRKVHMALVLDEYGGTAGLITIEDILEEIVGEIQDEYEPDEPAEPRIERVSDAVAEADGRAYIDDVNDKLGIELPEEEDYDTVGGFVFATLGHIPDAGESFTHANVRLTVVEAERTKVVRVRLEILDRVAAEPTGASGPAE